MRKVSSILWGIVLIAVGAVLSLNAFNITDIEIFFDGWWTLIIIIPCAIGLVSEKEKLGNAIGLLIGVFLLLCCLNVIEFDMIWKLALPVIIIMIGIKLIFGGIFSGKSAQMLKKAKENGADVKNGFAAFSGQDMNFDGEVFNGAELNAVFGGVKCDLRNAIIQNDCVITTSCIFGGIDILLPDHVNVKVNSNSLFGGVSDKKHSNSKDNTVTVYINSTCIFGGVDIK